MLLVGRMKRIMILLLLLTCAAFDDARMVELLEKMTFEEKLQQLLSANSRVAGAAGSLEEIVEEMNAAITERGVGYRFAAVR